MTRIIAITNQKGGVGKTTTSISLAASFVATKRKILLIDLDPQGNATMGSGIAKYDIPLSTNDVLLKEASINQVITKTPAGFDLLPSNSDLTESEVRLLQFDDRDQRLRQALTELTEKYEYILIDCPPSLNMLTVNALVAADAVIIPMQCEYYALEGLASLVQTIEQIKQTANPELEIDGILRTMFDKRNRLAIEVSDQLFEVFDTKVYRTVIPRNVRLAEAPSHGKPILQYDKKSQGAMAYLALAGEIIRKQQHTTNQTIETTEA